MASPLAIFTPEFARQAQIAVRRVLNLRVIGGRLDAGEQSMTIYIPNVAAGGGATASAVGRFRLKAEANDYLTCRTLDHTGSEGASDVLVAKHYYGQRTAFDGKTIGGRTYTFTGGSTRTVSDANGSETQIVVPSYKPTVVGPPAYAGDVIVAAEIEDGVGVNGPGDVPVTWIDLNADGRIWAELLS